MHYFAILCYSMHIVYVLHTIYVHPHIASCSEGTGITSMDIAAGSWGFSLPPPSIFLQNLYIDNLPRQPLTTEVVYSNQLVINYELIV